MDLPAIVGAALGTTSAMGGLILTIIFLAMVVCALLALKADTLIVLVVVVAVTAVLWGLAWAPLWLLIIEFIALVVLLAQAISGKAPAG